MIPFTVLIMHVSALEFRQFFRSISLMKDEFMAQSPVALNNHSYHLSPMTKYKLCLQYLESDECGSK